jgi:transcriptional regulator
MYIPSFNAVDEAEIRAMVAAVGSAELISTGADGYPMATLLPVLWRDDTVVAHLARANPHWEQLDDVPVLLVCTGAQAYVSPSWYAAKAEHGRVVPTWNYSSVHLRGRARVHQEVDWLREAVTDLTDRHEGSREERWHVADAPEAYIAGQLRGIVGVEITVENIEGKAKLSQNRSEADRAGVVAGLTATGARRDADVAEQMDDQY